MADSKLINKVSFFWVDKKAALRNRQLLKDFISRMFKAENKTLGYLRVIFCSDTYLLRINQEFLQHDDLTDIITFELSNTASLVEGEIYISLDRVAENAGIFGVPRHDELLRVIFHGALHLCGYRDKSPAEKRAMRMREDHYLVRYARFVSRETRST